jgi:hypothetical protein|tara:strand:+ start:946 stop:1125 length:180 start_codon:yes stop_codon:yes gene_type:complete
MEKEKKELEIIVHKNRTWKSKFSKDMNIMMEIIMQINSNTGKNKKYWCRVMDLYKDKYR